MANLQTNLTASRPGSIEELRDRHDEQFIRLTFRSLLGREADPDGLRTYTTELRKGIPADQVIAPIGTSTEAKLRWQGAVFQVKETPDGRRGTLFDPNGWRAGAISTISSIIRSSARPTQGSSESCGV